MKLIIAGGRNYTLDRDDHRRLDDVHDSMKVTEVVSGGAQGADKAGEVWAGLIGVPVKVFRADWAANGKYAGPMRNAEMAEYANAVVLFPGGKGTESMYREAMAHKLLIYDWREK